MCFIQMFAYFPEVSYMIRYKKNIFFSLFLEFCADSETAFIYFFFSKFDTSGVKSLRLPNKRV